MTVYEVVGLFICGAMLYWGFKAGKSGEVKVIPFISKNRGVKNG